MSQASWTQSWTHAVSEYLDVADPPPAYENLILGAQSSKEVVGLALNESRKPTESRHSTSPSDAADEVFLAAVLSAGTHPDLFVGTPFPASYKSPLVVSNFASTFLRYADSFDKALESLSNTCSPAAVLFAAMRFFISVAVKELNLFMTLKTQFEDFNIRLRRLDIYRKLDSPTEGTKLMFGKVTIDILRFTGLATKYLKSKVLADIAN
jgi:hypothetical protein